MISFIGYKMQLIDLKTYQEKMNYTRFCHRERSEAIYSHGIRLPQSHSLLRNDILFRLPQSHSFFCNDICLPTKMCIEPNK